MAIYKTVGGSWDTEELVWTSAKAPSRTHSYVYYNVILTRASVDATTATAKVYVWHGSQRGDLTGSGYCTLRWILSSGGVELRSDSKRKAYTNRITRTHVCILTAEIDLTGADEVDFQTKTNYSGSAYTTNAYVDCLLGAGSGRTNYQPTAISSIVRSDTESAWGVTVSWAPSTWTEQSAADEYIINAVFSSGNWEKETELILTRAEVGASSVLQVDKAGLAEVVSVSVTISDGYGEVTLEATYASTTKPPITISDQYERSIGFGCYPPAQDRTVEFGSDMAVIGAGGSYSTTPVRMGKYLDTSYSVYKVVVPFPGSSLSESFTAPAEIRRIVSAVGSGYGDGIGYWVPIPFASPTGLGWQASFRCAVSGDACTVELVKGSKVTFAGDSVYAEIEFVC
jgi:hypothetical protein